MCGRGGGGGWGWGGLWRVKSGSIGQQDREQQVT